MAKKNQKVPKFNKITLSTLSDPPPLRLIHIFKINNIHIKELSYPHEEEQGKGKGKGQGQGQGQGKGGGGFFFRSNCFRIQDGWSESDILRTNIKTFLCPI